MDRSLAPETECWIFSTYEREDGCEDAAEARARVLSLLYAIAISDVEVAGDGATGTSFPLMVLGTLSEKLVTLLAREDMHWLSPSRVVARAIDAAPSSREMKGVLSALSIPYVKWLIEPPPSVPEVGEEKAPPEGLVYSRPHRSELRTVLARSEIPRKEETLAGLGSAGVRVSDLEPTSDGGLIEGQGHTDDGELVAWAFLGVDGSLTSLHVEPPYRGKGLAKACSARLFSLLAREPEAMGFRPLDTKGGEGWAHSDVAEDHFESAGVARGLGGREGWRIRWVGVDLDRVRVGTEQDTDRKTQTVGT